MKKITYEAKIVLRAELDEEAACKIAARMLRPTRKPELPEAAISFRDAQETEDLFKKEASTDFIRCC